MNKIKYSITKIKYNIGKYIRKEPFFYDENVQDIVNQIKKHGYAIVPSFYTKEECEALRNETDILL